MISMHAPNPEQHGITAAIDAYLSKGGKITRLPSGMQTDDLGGSITRAQLNKANKVKQKRSMLMFQGKMRTRKEISGMAGMEWQTIRNRMSRGDTLEQAVSKPVRKSPGD